MQNKAVLLMDTLHKNDALFNTNLTISHDGGCLSSDA